MRSMPTWLPKPPDVVYNQTVNRRQSFLRHPIYQSVIVTVLALGAYAYLTHYRLGGFRENLLFLLIDGALLAIGYLFWMGFFSQFVLPVLSLSERAKAFQRLFAYLLGERGPAIFIENGEVRSRPEELRRRGAGVILLDTASAGVLRNASAFTRSIGPGIVFTEPSEYLAGTVDLHIQTQRLGPNEAEDPFAARGQDESTEAYDRRQQRRWETSGLTRDGVEVVPVIHVTFRLDSFPGQRGTQFGYNPNAVWSAIASQGINPDEPPDARTRHVPWNWLPVHLASDLWREYLRKFILNELFVFSNSEASQDPASERQTAFETIHEMVALRLTEETVPEMNELGQKTGREQKSREFRILEERGIRVENVTINDLHFPSSVETDLVKQWKATWLDRAEAESKLVDLRRSRQKILGEQEAVLDFAEAASQLLGPKVIQNTSTPELLPDHETSLELLVRGTLNRAVRDQALQTKLTSERAQLAEIVEWIRRQ